MPVASAQMQLSLSHPSRAVDAISQHRFESADGRTFADEATHLMQSKQIPSIIGNTLLEWYTTYRLAAEKNPGVQVDAGEFSEEMFSTLLELARRCLHDPIDFGAYHERVRTPFDYYKFGHDFASVLLNVEASIVDGKENALQAVEYVKRGENVVFFSNHQSEGDPYAIDFLLDWVGGCDKKFCEEMIFMAGDRVRNDPVVAPFSAGRNLLTVYSKKHLNDEPELKDMKLRHNRKTIIETLRLFNEGGKAVWFAPSGGRDRRETANGCVEISDMDASAIDMMRVTANRCKTKTHFYPMALWTYDMLPPPSAVGGKTIGEQRIVEYTPMHLWVGEEMKWEFEGEKVERRLRQKKELEARVKEGYRRIGGYER